jgi:hypothetical protein
MITETATAGFGQKRRFVGDRLEAQTRHLRYQGLPCRATASQMNHHQLTDIGYIALYDFTQCVADL